MSFTPAPKTFFGNDYALTSSAISLKTSTAADTAIAGFFTADGSTAALTVAIAHNLKVGDKVSLTTSGTLPAGLSTGTDYFVVTVTSSTVLELSATRGGIAIIPSDTGTGNHTLNALASLQELTDTDAHASTGDWREVVFALAELFYQKFSNTPSADRPTNLTIQRSDAANSDGTFTRNYFISVNLETSDVSVAAE